MELNEQEQLIQNFLEGLDSYNEEFFSPLEKNLYEDIRERLIDKDEEEINRLQKFFSFPIIPKKEEEKDSLNEISDLLEQQDFSPKNESLETIEEPDTFAGGDETFKEDIGGGIGDIDTGIEDSGVDLGGDIGGIDTGIEDSGVDIGGLGSGDDVESTLPDLNLEEGLQELDFEGPKNKEDISNISPLESSFDLDFKDTSIESKKEDFETLDTTDFGISEDELKEMQQKSLLDEGIGKEFTEQELAQLRQAILSYSEPLRKAILDAIVNEKISRTEQKILINMLIEQAEESTLLDFIEEKLGYRPKVATVEKTREGIPIIYTDDISPEALERKRKRTKFFLIASGSLVIGIIMFLVGIRINQFLSVKNLYEKGLEILYNAQELPINQQEEKIKMAEYYFSQALQNDGKYNIKYLNLYGNAYIKLGKYDMAFEKLFGKIDPEYQWNYPEQRVPLITRLTSWKTLQELKRNEYTEFTSSDKIKRKLIVPGGFTVAKLRDGTYNKQNIINLAKFHSLNFPNFINSEEGKKYKNDSLAIDYYRIILTLMDAPLDPEAISGIAKIYYNQKNYVQAISEYQKIVDNYPDNIVGHDGILNAYLEIWKQDKDPRYVIAKHRFLENLGLEKKLQLYTLAKLAGFYIDLNPEDLRIKYNIDPVNYITNLSLQDTSEKLLDMIYNKKEEREDIKIQGSEYGEGFYQRGRYYTKLKQYQNAVKQFQNAFYFDPRHFPAILEIGEYYLYRLKDYDKAKEYFLKSLEVYLKYKDFYGIRPEDETLESFDKGLIYYNISSVIYEKYNNEFIPTITSLNEPDEKYQMMLREFISTEDYNLKAIELLQDVDKKNASYFRQGFIEYINGSYDNAIRSWLFINDPKKIYYNPNYFLALGNASFKKEQMNQSLDFYKSAERILEEKEKLEQSEIKLLYNVYNNLGANYEALFYKNERRLTKSKLDELRQKSLNYYYKALEFAIQNKIIPVKAKYNLDTSFKREFDQIQLEDSILPVLEIKKNQ